MIYLERDGVRIREGDAGAELRELEDESVQCAVTSPPYWALRDYGHSEQLGAEPTPAEYVEHLVEILSELRRVLSPSGTLWLNLGDTYATAGGRNADPHGSLHLAAESSDGTARSPSRKRTGGSRRRLAGFKPKDLVGIPWRVALALQEDGWWLRADVIWDKPNAMPESVTDRPTLSHEHMFMLTRSQRYFYDQDAAREPYEAPESVAKSTSPLYHPPGGGAPHTGLHPVAKGPDGRHKTTVTGADGSIQHRDGERWPHAEGRNARSVWHIPHQPYPGAHFATMPEELVRRCIASSSRAGDVVLDPFAGTGTVLLVARRLGRPSIGIELNTHYCELAARRALGVQTRWLEDDVRPADCGTLPLDLRFEVTA